MTPLPDLTDQTEWQAAERREERRAHRWNAAATIFFALVLALSALAGNISLAVFAGLAILIGAFNLQTLRRRGIWGTPPTARLYSAFAGIAALFSLADVALAVLYALDDYPEPTVVFGTFGVGFAVFAWILHLYARFIADAVAAFEEPVRAICAEAFGLLRVDDPPVALVLTSTRLAQVRRCERGVSEIRSMDLGEITAIDAIPGRRGSRLVVRGGDQELSVGSVPPPQVQNMLAALHDAGVRTAG